MPVNARHCEPPFLDFPGTARITVPETNGYDLDGYGECRKSAIIFAKGETMANISLDEEQFKILLKQTLIELFEERRDIFSAILADALEELGLAAAIREGRVNELVSEEKIQSILGG